MRLALTGVPATGKTTVAKALAARGIRVVHLNEFAAEHDLLGDADPIRGSLEIDLDALDDALATHLDASAAEHAVLEGHFAHELDVDAVFLLRASPQVLHARMQERGWPDAKIHENIEAEALDILASEVRETELPAVELDASARDVGTIVAAVESFLSGKDAGDVVGTAMWDLDELTWL